MKPIESKRVALDRKIVLRFPDFDGFVTEFAANLSMTGMFVASEEPQRPGTPVAFELRLEDGAPLVRGGGWVVWSRERAEAPDRPAGMGIEFIELDHKSRRLVRWMILNQMPEGSRPYEVHSESAGGAPALRRAPRGTSGGGRRILLPAGLLFVALTAVVFRGESCGRRDATEPTSVDLTATTPAVSTEPGPRAEGRPPGSASVDAGAAIEAAVKSWARAWSDQDVDRYLKHYASGFEPSGGLSRRQWSDQRRQRVAAPTSIRVAVTRLEATVGPEGEARVSFLQTYRSDGYADTVDKVLEFVLEDGVWKIRRESAD